MEVELTQGYCESLFIFWLGFLILTPHIFLRVFHVSQYAHAKTFSTCGYERELCSSSVLRASSISLKIYLHEPFVGLVESLLSSWSHMGCGDRLVDFLDSRFHWVCLSCTVPQSVWLNKLILLQFCRQEVPKSKAGRHDKGPGESKAFLTSASAEELFGILLFAQMKLTVCCWNFLVVVVSKLPLC